jgi:hypothetical protein
MIIGLPSLEIFSVFTFVPFISVTVAFGSLKSTLSAPVSCANKAVPKHKSNVTKKMFFMGLMLVG